MADLYEENIEDWYYHERSNMPLVTYLCDRIYLKSDEKSCLYERNIIYKKEEL